MIKKIENVNLNLWKTSSPRLTGVIAASSAINSRAGFLERRVNSHYSRFVDGTGRQIYVCDDTDDCEKEIDSALLNTRGWVLQERVLPRRTIHFSTNHTYWKCGEGVCCENLNRLER